MTMTTNTDLLRLASMANVKAKAYRDAIDDRPGNVQLGQRLGRELLDAVEALTAAVAAEAMP